MVALMMLFSLHNVGLAIDFAGDQLVGLGVIGKARAGADGELAPHAIADVGEMAERGAEEGIRNRVIEILDVARAAGRKEVFHVQAGGIGTRSALGLFFLNDFVALTLIDLIAD